MSKKTGPFSLQEQRILTDNLELLSDAELAKMLNRKESAIAKFRATKKRPEAIAREEVAAIKSELKTEYFWNELKLQFTDEELEMFSARWIELTKQFGDSVVATDKMQMVDLIRHEVLLHRVLVDEKEILEQIRFIKKRIKEIESLPHDDENRDNDELLSLMRERGALLALQGAKSNEIKQVQNDKNTLFKQLKTTRDQRIDKLQSDKKDFWDLIRMLDEVTIKEREGRRMELMKTAAYASEVELTKNIVYADKMVDKPILNYNSVILDDIEIKDSNKNE